MNTNEAKFILRARRPDGRDDADPRFAEALAQARRDPALGAWLAREQAFDEAVTACLRDVSPPAGLRDAILAGARMQQTTPWWREARWLGLAAALALLLGLAASVTEIRPSAPGAEQLALGAMDDWMLDSHHMEPLGGSGALRAAVMNPASRLLAGLALEPATLKAGGCRVITLAGREVHEVCFEREGAGELHLYIALRGDFGGDGFSETPMFRERGTLASVSWADERYAYVLVSDQGANALRAVL
jgi:hypothetical protein